MICALVTFNKALDRSRRETARASINAKFLIQACSFLRQVEIILLWLVTLG